MWLIPLLLLAAPACHRDAPPGGGGGPVGAEDDGGDAGDAGGDDSAAPPAWGLDSRPANPTCVAPARPLPAPSQARVEAAFPALRFYRPTNLVHPPGDDRHWTVTESEGQVLRFENRADVAETTVFLDLSAKVYSQQDGAGEMGLLGLAFHPDFATNGQVFVSYTLQLGDGTLQSRISRFTSTDGGATADPASEQVVLRLAQPRITHNGGRIVFGPDGMLWLAFGDGGGQEGRTQADRLDNLYGKISRIDVDGGSPYAVPADNPHVDGVVPEAWAWGFRNPWGWDFDSATGDLWVGDVGAAAWEELDLARKGGHYGWPCCEGPDCVASPATYPTCSAADHQDPVLAYTRDEGRVIVAGPVYHGAAIPGLEGAVLVGDYLAQWLKAVRRDASGAPTLETLVEDVGFKISGFAEDAAGEVYVLGFSGAAQVYKLVPAGEDTGEADPFPTRLSETGCFDPADPRQPVAGMLPYDLNAPFWSDGLDKERWFALPDGTSIAVGSDGRWELPVGSVVAKTFSKDGQPVETRLLVRHEDGGWAGYTYVWAGSDATLVRTGRRLDLGGQAYAVPAEWQCLVCHRGEGGRTLGLETAQLDRSLTYPSTGRTADQLLTLEHIGVLGETPPAVTPMADPHGGDEAGARAWLHTNCAMCHEPEAAGMGSMDLRATTPLAEMGLCDVVPGETDLGVEGARLLAPGDPARSLLALRPRRDDVWRMPPLASLVVDEVGVSGVEAWIAGVAACPAEGG